MDDDDANLGGYLYEDTDGSCQSGEGDAYEKSANRTDSSIDSSTDLTSESSNGEVQATIAQRDIYYAHWPIDQNFPYFVTRTNRSTVFLQMEDVPRDEVGYFANMTMPVPFITMQNEHWTTLMENSSDLQMEIAETMSFYSMPPFPIWTPVLWLLLHAKPYLTQRHYPDEWFSNTKEWERAQTVQTVLTFYMKLVHYIKSTSAQRDDVTEEQNRILIAEHDAKKKIAYTVMQRDLQEEHNAFIQLIDTDPALVEFSQAVPNKDQFYERQHARHMNFMFTFIRLCHRHIVRVVRIYECFIMRMFGFSPAQIAFFASRQDSIVPAAQVSKEKRKMLVAEQLKLAENINIMTQALCQESGRPYHRPYNVDELRRETVNDRIGELYSPRYAFETFQVLRKANEKRIVEGLMTGQLVMKNEQEAPAEEPFSLFDRILPTREQVQSESTQYAVHGRTHSNQNESSIADTSSSSTNEEHYIDVSNLEDDCPF